MDEIAELRRGLLAFFVFIRERRQAWSLLRHEMALIGTPAADEIEQIRRQQTDLRTEATAEFVVGACERLAIWCERHEDVSPELATEYAMNVLWSGLSGRSR